MNVKRFLNRKMSLKKTTFGKTDGVSCNSVVTVCVSKITCTGQEPTCIKNKIYKCTCVPSAHIHIADRCPTVCSRIVDFGTFLHKWPIMTTNRIKQTIDNTHSFKENNRCSDSQVLNTGYDTCRRFHISKNIKRHTSKEAKYFKI